MLTGMELTINIIELFTACNINRYSKRKIFIITAGSFIDMFVAIILIGKWQGNSNGLSSCFIIIPDYSGPLLLERIFVFLKELVHFRPAWPRLSVSNRFIFDKTNRRYFFSRTA